MNTIAIIYICTGKYNQFFEEFYSSCEKYFLISFHKEFFVFTDDPFLSDKKNVHLIQKECKGFPFDSLMRFEMFLSIKKNIKSFDYVFFFNANMKFLQPINSDILPTDDDGGLCAVIQPGYYNKSKIFFPFEKNRKSTAYIKYQKGKTYRYYMGSLFGGKYEQFYKLTSECANAIQKDLDNNIIATVHDESHLNKYLSDHLCLALNPGYAYPEGWHLPFEPIILLRDKVKIDKYFDKGRKHDLISRLKLYIIKLYKGLKWIFS